MDLKIINLHSACGSGLSRSFKTSTTVFERVLVFLMTISVVSCTTDSAQGLLWEAKKDDVTVYFYGVAHGGNVDHMRIPPHIQKIINATTVYGFESVRSSAAPFESRARTAEETPGMLKLLNALKQKNLITEAIAQSVSKTKTSQLDTLIPLIYDHLESLNLAQKKYRKK